MAELKRLTEGVWVAGQLQPEDFARAEAAGICTIVNNRPDGEAPDQLDDVDAAAEAARLGLGYLHLPVENGGMTETEVGAFREALAEWPGPVLAYCRSGTRSTWLWAFAVVPELGVDAVIEAAAAQGYDLAPARPALAKAATAEA